MTLSGIGAGGPLIIDAANVVGSVPDGWWRDRLGATERLRDRVAQLAQGPDAVEVILVVEGAASRVAGVPGVRVVAAPRTGDDTIVELVGAAGRPVTVITADRALRERVETLGATVVGPGTLLGRLPDAD